MHYYLALTSKCNLLCKYCYGKTTQDFLSEKEKKQYDLNLPSEINFNTKQLEKFAKDDKDFALTFYGGEPLLKINLIKEMMDTIPAKTFMLQTNGIFLDKLGKKYTNKLNTILVSLDGTKEHTNERRGIKVYEKVIKNLNQIKEEGCKAEIIARMTVDETSNIYKNVTYFFTNNDFKFNSVHWQLDAQFWKADYLERDFKTWVITKYNPKIKKLINWWIDKMNTENKVLMIYPFIGIINSIMFNDTMPMKCGAGHSLLGIQTNGDVVACPITAGYKPFKMGDIKNSTLKDIKNNEMLPQNTCLDCSIYDICGGRCLYANDTKLWGQKGFDEVCDTVFFLVNSLKRQIPKIEKLIKEGKISKKDFIYNKYNGCEIIP